MGRRHVRQARRHREAERLAFIAAPLPDDDNDPGEPAPEPVPAAEQTAAPTPAPQE